MIIRLAICEKIRDLFTESEKDLLNGAITGQAICPRGPIIDETRLPDQLREKLLKAMAEAKSK
jgi:hypothetical protein